MNEQDQEMRSSPSDREKETRLLMETFAGCCLSQCSYRSTVSAAGESAPIMTLKLYVVVIIF